MLVQARPIAIRGSTHPVRSYGFGSLGRPSTRSPTMLRWIWLVPPQIVSEREKKNADIIGLTGYPGRRWSRPDPGHEPLSGPASIEHRFGAEDVEASSIACWCISDQNILFARPERGDAEILACLISVADRMRRPLTRRIWIFV